MRNFDDRIENLGATAPGRLSAAEDNVRFRELENAVSTAGITLDPQSGPDTDLTMVAQAMARYASRGVVGTAGGSANALTVAALGSSVVPKALFDMMLLTITPSATNTGPTTANVFGLGSKKVLSFDGSELRGGELVSGRPTAWQYSAAADTGTGAWLVLPWDASGVINIINTMPRVFLSSSGTQNVASGVNTALTSFGGVTNSRFLDPATSFSGGTLTVRGRDAGLWFVNGYAAATVNTRLRFYVQSNGADLAGNATDLNGLIVTPINTAAGVVLADNQTINLSVLHATGSSVPFNYQLMAFRVGAV